MEAAQNARRPAAMPHSPKEREHGQRRASDPRLRARIGKRLQPLAGEVSARPTTWFPPAQDLPDPEAHRATLEQPRRRLLPIERCRVFQSDWGELRKRQWSTESQTASQA